MGRHRLRPSPCTVHTLLLRCQRSELPNIWPWRNKGVNVSLIIGNEDVPASDGATFERRDPASGELASSAPAASVKDALKTADAASAAFASWSSLGPTARRQL